MVKRCLIVDNDEQSSIIETIVRRGRTNGLTIICEEFNVGMLDKDVFFTDGKIDLDKVIQEFKRSHKSKTYHLAAFDWNLGDEHVTGVEVIKKFQDSRLLVNTPKILYSGLLKDEISTALEGYKDGTIKKTKLLAWITALIKVDVRSFVDRLSYEQEILTQLLKTDETLDLIIEEELKKFPELKFHNSFTSKSFNGKTFTDIAKALENDDLLRNNFKKEIVLQVISYLTEKI